jgi:hypothetical protein
MFKIDPQFSDLLINAKTAYGLTQAYKRVVTLDDDESREVHRYICTISAHIRKAAGQGLIGFNIVDTQYVPSNQALCAVIIDYFQSQGFEIEMRTPDTIVVSWTGMIGSESTTTESEESKTKEEVMDSNQQGVFDITAAEAVALRKLHGTIQSELAPIVTELATIISTEVRSIAALGGSEFRIDYKNLDSLKDLNARVDDVTFGVYGSNLKRQIINHFRKRGFDVRSLGRMKISVGW